MRWSNITLPHVHIYQITNTADQLTAQEVMGLQDLVVTLSKCAGSECYDAKQILNKVMISNRQIS